MPIYHLALRGPLHVGEAVSIDRETVLEWMPSDSLFSALVTGWSESGADVEARLDEFLRGDVPLRLTSAFPWAAGIRFFPATAAMPGIPGLESKQVKRLRWLSAGVLGQLLAGQGVSPSEADLLHGGKVLVTQAERKGIPPRLLDEDGRPRLWQTYVVPRVTVDRISNASNLFHAGRVSFADGGGLWFAARGPRPDWVREGLDVLADAGLGGLRNYGHGAFSFTEQPDDLPKTPLAGPGLCLSRYAPIGEAEIRETLQREGAAYRLVTVGGWCTDEAGQGWRRRAVRLLAEGALIPDVAVARGGLIEVQPDLPQFAKRKVYRSALPFFISAGALAPSQEVTA